MLAELFLQPTWLYAALAVIPIILLYLLRPRPKTKTIPSLMFLLRDKGKKSLTGFLRKLIVNTLLVIHLLAILLFAAALAQPFLEVPAITAASNNVLILDNSASMHATDNNQPRYQQARNEAINALGRRNTVILAGTIPEVVLEQASREEATNYINNWQPSHQPLRLRPAIIEAQRHAEADTAVTIISDFQDTETNTDYTDAIRTIQALGVTVHLQHVGTTNTNNVAITSVDARDTQTTIQVRNYDTQPRAVSACIAGNCQEFSLQAQETQSWSFSTPPGVSEVILDTQDDLSIDDRAYISAEEQTTIRTLVVTNGNWQESNLAQALSAIQRTTPLTFETTINRPPALTTVDHDLIIFYDINPNTVVSRTIRDAQQAVEQGAGAIIHYQEALFSIPYEQLLPVNFIEEAGAASILSTDAVRAYIGMDFGSTPQHYITTPTPRAVVIAQTNQEHPVIVRERLGAGTTLYYGLPTTASFSNNPEYPLFWKETLDDLLQRQSAQTLTRTVGEVITSDQPVRTPAGETRRGTILLDKVGVYTIGEQQLVANLANQQESNINAPPPSGAGIERILTQEERTREQNITVYVLWALLALISLELIYLKYRGDL